MGFLCLFLSGQLFLMEEKKNHLSLFGSRVGGGCIIAQWCTSSLKNGVWECVKWQMFLVKKLPCRHECNRDAKSLPGETPVMMKIIIIMRKKV